MDPVISRPFDMSLVFLRQLTVVGIFGIFLAVITAITILYSDSRPENESSRTVRNIILAVGWLVWLFMAGRFAQFI